MLGILGHSWASASPGTRNPASQRTKRARLPILQSLVVRQSILPALHRHPKKSVPPQAPAKREAQAHNRRPSPPRGGKAPTTTCILLRRASAKRSRSKRARSVRHPNSPYPQSKAITHKHYRPECLRNPNTLDTSQNI